MNNQRPLLARRLGQGRPELAGGADLDGQQCLSRSLSEVRIEQQLAERRRLLVVADQLKLADDEPLNLLRAIAVQRPSQRSRGDLTRRRVLVAPDAHHERVQGQPGLSVAPLR